MLYRLSLMCLILLSYSVRADDVLETQDLADVQAHLDENTWVILDIDNTVCHTKGQLGSDAWFRWRSQGAKRGDGAFEVALDEFTALQFIVPMTLCQDNTAEIIKKLQDENYTVLAVTSRGIRVATRTVYQLRELGVNFVDSSPGAEEMFWPRGWNGRREQHVLYEQGILFNAGQNKGQGLKKLLAGLDTKPTKILFVDDCRQHVVDVQQACKELDIPCVGMHYTRMDAWVEQFDPEQAKKKMDLIRSLAA